MTTTQTASERITEEVTSWESGYLRVRVINELSHYG